MLLREEAQSSPEKHPWDLEERTAVFGERIVGFSKKIPRDPSNNRLIDQLVGAGTSVGANYCEASQAVSKKDFKNIVSRCVKEAKESKFFLRMVVASEPHPADEARPLYREAHELLCIFGSMRNK
jgi:four helix bundle protein